MDPRGRTAVYSAVDQGYLQHSRARDLETGQETTLPFALYEHRFSRDGQWIAGESREGELVVCASSTGRCRPLTPKDDDGLTGLAWSADGSHLFFLRPTSARVFGELKSVSVEGGEAKTHGPIGPFQHRFQMSMDVSPRDEIVFAPLPRRPTRVMDGEAALVSRPLYPNRGQKLQIRDDVVNVVVCQHDEAAQGPRTNRVLRLREVEEPLIVSDGVAERLGAVVVEVGRGVLDAPERRDLEQSRKEGAGNDGRWRWRRRSGVEEQPDIGRADRHHRVDPVVDDPRPDRIVGLR